MHCTVHAIVTMEPEFGGWDGFSSRSIVLHGVTFCSQLVSSDPISCKAYRAFRHLLHVVIQVLISREYPEYWNRSNHPDQPCFSVVLALRTLALYGNSRRICLSIFVIGLALLAVSLVSRMHGTFYMRA